ncbi:MAG TPA: aminoglycoside phosphotransferase family protein [Spirochaetia bacterium]|nr:aminoglycoside phosphotransferase family protein [Spirochaetia bacterium]
MDPAVLGPHVRWVCAQNGFSCRSILPGTAGTFPTFVVDRRVVVKLFGPLFEGRLCWRVEREAAELVRSIPSFPAAGVLAFGRLADPGWRYIVYRFVQGRSIGQARRRVSHTDLRALARRLGSWVRDLHALEVGARTALPRLTARKLASWYAAKRARGFPGWPAHLAAQADAFLSAAGLSASPITHLIHGDLTADHVLGELRHGRWRTSGVIDFGDCMRGDLFYELGALHLDLFDADKRLLSVFLSSYRVSREDQEGFERKAMARAICHRFDVLGPTFARKPRLRRLDSLDEVAAALWQV